MVKGYTDCGSNCTLIQLGLLYPTPPGLTDTVLLPRFTKAMLKKKPNCYTVKCSYLWETGMNAIYLKMFSQQNKVDIEEK